jgi:hypothetical protein
MRNTFFRVLPYLMGAAIGVFLANPPAFFSALGPWRPLALIAAMAIGLLASTGISMWVSLPARIRVEPLTEDAGAISPEVVRLMNEYRVLGFEPSEGPGTVHIRPLAYTWPFLHRESGCRGSVFATSTIPRKVGYEIASYIEGGEGVLSTSANPAATVLPSSPGDFKEVIRDGTPRQLLAAHLRARAFLESRGYRFKPPGTSRMQERLQRSIAKQRRAIAANPFKAVAVAWWRAVMKTSPYLGPLESQAGLSAHTVMADSRSSS